jgi:hypothetical protein
VAAPSAADLTPGADEPHALEPIGLAEIDSEPPALESLAKRVRDGIFWRVDAWACAARELAPDEGPLAPLLDDYHARLALLGGPVVALSPAGELLAQGVFSHVDAWGCAPSLPRRRARGTSRRRRPPSDPSRPSPRGPDSSPPPLPSSRTCGRKRQDSSTDKNSRACELRKRQTLLIYRSNFDFCGRTNRG